MGDSYFHWTDESSYKEIIRKKNIFQSIMTTIFGFPPKDLVPGSGNAYYGEGVYFTDYGPDYARSTIAGACFGHSQSQDQVECYFEIEFHGNTKITQENPHTWLLSPKSTATQHIVDHGYHPDFESDDDDDDDDDDEWVPSCNNCDSDEDVSDPGGDYYYCSNCELEIDDEGDSVTEQGICPWCDDEPTLCTENDDYYGQQIYTCCCVYFDENGNLWPDENPNGDYCRFCGQNLYADDCPKELCGTCCDGSGCSRHGDDDDDDWVPICKGCDDDDDVVDPGGDYYWCNYCEIDIDEDGNEV